MCGFIPTYVCAFIRTQSKPRAQKRLPVFPLLCAMFSSEQGAVLKRTEEPNCCLMAVLRDKSVPHLSLGRATPNYAGYLWEDFVIIYNAKVAGI